MASLRSFPALHWWCCVLLASVLGCGSAVKNDYVPPPPPSVTVELPVQEEITETKDYTGTTRAFEEVEIRARVEGFLEEINFRDGEEVKAGQLLAKIDDRPFKAALAQAEASVALAKARLESARAGLSQKKAELANAQMELKRAEAVVARSPGAITESEVDLRRTNVMTAQAMVEASQADIESAQAEIAAGEAEVLKAQLNLDYTQVHSPIAGRASAKNFDVGSLVGRSDSSLLTTITQSDPIYAYFTLSENDFLEFNRQRIAEGRVAGGNPGKHVYPLFLALSDEADFTHEGYCDYTDTSIDESTGTFMVRGRFDNPQALIPPGAFVRIEVPLGQKEAMLVNPTAVGRDQAGAYLMVVNDEDTIEMRRVTLGHEYKGMQIVADGELQPTDRVVVKGIQFVRPGLKVTPHLAQEAAEEAKAPAGEPAAS